MAKMLAIVGLLGMLATALTSFGREDGPAGTCTFTALGDVAACE